MKFNIQSLENYLSVTGIVNVHYFEFSEDFHTKSDSHPFYELVYVLGGRVEIKSQDYTGILSDRQLIIHRPDESHSLSCDQKHLPTVIIIGFTCDGNSIDEFSKKPFVLSQDEIKELAEIVKEGRNVFAPPYNVSLGNMKKREQSPMGSEQMLKNLLECFLIHIMRSSQTVTEQNGEKIPIGDIINYLENNYRERITIDQLAFIYNTNRSTLCREFKRSAGKTVIDFINEKKCNESKRLLLNSRMNITQIAAEIGFDSIHYFTRFFKKETGYSPSEYRKEHSERYIGEINNSDCN